MREDAFNGEWKSGRSWKENGLIHSQTEGESKEGRVRWKEIRKESERKKGVKVGWNWREGCDLWPSSTVLLFLRKRRRNESLFSFIELYFLSLSNISLSLSLSCIHLLSLSTLSFFLTLWKRIQTFPPTHCSHNECITLPVLVINVHCKLFSLPLLLIPGYAACNREREREREKENKEERKKQ